MSDKDITAEQLISLGRYLTVLNNPQNATGQVYRTSTSRFLNLLERCEFPATSAAAKTIDGCTFFVDSITGFITPASVTPLKFALHSIESCLTAEATKKTVILSDVEPPEQLNSLPQLKPHQEALKHDLVMCLKCHLSRPAIVLAWALGFDLVRSWVHDDTTGRLAAFIQQLVNTRRGSEPQTIADYHDFFKVGEIRFLEICRDSQDVSLREFTDKTLRSLQALLDQRNEFAHANYSHANESEAKSYFLRMLRILAHEPFTLFATGNAEH